MGDTMNKILLICVLSLPLGALAGDYHTLPNTPIICESCSEVPVAAPPPDYRGTALGIATGNHHHDFGTHKWQWSAAYGHYQDNDAFSVSIGKRVDRVLINGSIGREGSETGYGVGLNGRF